MQARRLLGILLKRMANVNDVELGYKFETLVAAALVRYDGTVAQLIHEADIGFESRICKPIYPKYRDL